MTRKDFEMIALTLANAKHGGVLNDEQLHAMAVRFAGELQKTNSRFDAERFINRVVEHANG